jgi:hypothetical protein
MSITAWRTAGTAANVDRGFPDWTGLTNTTSSNNAYASVSNLSQGLATDYLQLTNFGFSADLPASATVVGIEVEIERSTGALTIVDDTIRLRKATGQVGTSKADPSTAWPTVDAARVYGGATDLWSTSSLILSAVDIRDSGFGLDIAAQATAPGFGARALIDFVRVRIHYTNTIAVSPNQASTASGIFAVTAKQSLLRPQPGFAVAVSGIFTPTISIASNLFIAMDMALASTEAFGPSGQLWIIPMGTPAAVVTTVITPFIEGPPFAGRRVRFTVGGKHGVLEVVDRWSPRYPKMKNRWLY